VTGARRKALANAIGEILEAEVVYNKAPTFSYSIADLTLDRYGTMTYPCDVIPEIIEVLINTLNERGFDSEYSVSETEDSDRLVIEIPRSHLPDEAFENLNKIVKSKESLFKKALGADRLPIFSDEQNIRFPWFTLTGADGEADAYTKFVSALCEMAKRQKRVTAKEKESNNDKFDMRVFLIRLGFVGDEYKQARKILLRNLTGNSSFKWVVEP